VGELTTIRAYKSERTKITREILRRRIDGEECIDKIIEALVFLQSMRAIELNVSTGQYIAPPPVDSVTISAVKAEIDARMKLLNKVLPDLKAIELKDTIGQPVINGRLMSDTELVHRLRHLGMSELAAPEDDEDEGVDINNTSAVPSLF
jgi:hypothetical protein